MSEDYGLCTMCGENPATHEPYYGRMGENYLCGEGGCWADWMQEHTHEIGTY
tara:strand:+ start:219 stop:374 length:156 start_codon:yes stop_codon:yes gene_type:complete